jgi:hypothetical protein
MDAFCQNDPLLRHEAVFLRVFRLFYQHNLHHARDVKSAFKTNASA